MRYFFIHVYMIVFLTEVQMKVTKKVLNISLNVLSMLIVLTTLNHIIVCWNKAYKFYNLWSRECVYKRVTHPFSIWVNLCTCLWVLSATHILYSYMPHSRAYFILSWKFSSHHTSANKLKISSCLYTIYYSKTFSTNFYHFTRLKNK